MAHKVCVCVVSSCRADAVASLVDAGAGVLGLEIVHNEIDVSAAGTG